MRTICGKKINIIFLCFFSTCFAHRLASFSLWTTHYRLLMVQRFTLTCYIKSMLIQLVIFISINRLVYKLYLGSLSKFDHIYLPFNFFYQADDAHRHKCVELTNYKFPLLIQYTYINTRKKTCTDNLTMRLLFALIV